MILFVQIIGALIILAGFIYLICPKKIKGMVKFWIKGRRIYWAAMINLLIGMALVMAATNCEMKWIVYIFGIISLLKAALLFSINRTHFEKMLLWWSDRPANIIRFMGILALAMGLLLVYAA